MSNIFIGALIFGIWYVTLFFGKSIGLSMFLFAVPITIYIMYLLKKHKKIENAKTKVLIIPIALLSSTYFIYNNEFFNKLNILVIPSLMSIMIIGMFNEKMAIKNIIGEILEIIFRPILFITETYYKLIENIKEKFKLKTESKNNRKIWSIIKGILITIPLVALIIALLASADETFGNIFKHMLVKIIEFIFHIHISSMVLRIIFMVISFFYFASLFNYILTEFKIEGEEIINTNERNNTLTIKMILGALNVIYLLFCIIQIKSLFIQNLNINYAQYARQGFFQLMIVSAINLVTILIAKKSDIENKNKYITTMCILMIIFTFIILISSVVRMYYYESVFGYTLLRLLVYCALITEGMLLVPTILYVLNKKVKLQKIYFIIILTIYICMNFANFDNMIAKRNINRYLATGKFDFYYLKSKTGTDAIPQIAKILEIENLDDTLKQDVKSYLDGIDFKLNYEDMDFRNFNFSKVRAKNILASKNLKNDNN